MSEKIVQPNEEVIKGRIKESVHGSAEETLSELLEKEAESLTQAARYPYVYVDGIYLRRNWGGEYENVSVLVAIAVNEDGFREVLGAVEGMKEDKASWVSFFQWLRGRGLDGVKLIVSPHYAHQPMLAAIRTALKKSMNMPPTIGMAKYATGEGPYFFVMTCILAIAFEVAPMAKPMKPAVMTAAS